MRYVLTRTSLSNLPHVPPTPEGDWTPVKMVFVHGNHEYSTIVILWVETEYTEYKVTAFEHD